MRFRKRSSLVIGGSLFLLILTGCGSFRAYYNTFYLAEKTFRLAEENRLKSKSEKANPTVLKLYEEAIAKASKLLSFYPKSKYVDDALLIIGKSYYYMGEYSKAERKFQEIVTGFPKSGLASEANFFLGLNYFKLNQLSDAAVVWQTILQDEKQKKFHKDALFSLANLRYESKEYDEAVKLFRFYLSRYKKDAKAGQAQRLIAESFWEQEDYENAWKAYTEVRNFTDDKELIYLAEYNAGQTAYLLNKITEGMATFKRLADNKDYYPHLAEIKLELARGRLFSGQVEQAVKLNEEVITAYPKTPQSAQAYYQLGIIQQDYKDDLKAAKENFDKAKDEKPGSDYSKKALEKSADITKLEEYRKQLTEGEAEKSVETQFLLAEFYLTHMNKPDSALATYKDIAVDHPQSEFAPKALLAMAYICSEVARDSIGCRQACQKLIQNYPATDYAVTAARILSQEPESKLSASAAQLFHQGEEQLFTWQNSDSASTLYQAIIDSFPSSVYVPRAMLGKALILEQTYQVTTPDTSAPPETLFSPIVTDTAIAFDTSAATSLVNDSAAANTTVADDTSSVGDSSVVAAVGDTSRLDTLRAPVFDSTVYLAYKSILDKYPDSEAARVAQMKLGLKEKPKPKPAPEKKPQTRADSLASLQPITAPAEGDTVDTLVQGLPLAPEPISKGTFVYPPELIPEQISGYVFLKLEIEYFSGEVKRLEIMEGSITNEEIRKRVRQVMVIAKFDTSRLNPAYFASIYGYRFKIIPPPITTQ